MPLMKKKPRLLLTLLSRNLPLQFQIGLGLIRFSQTRLECLLFATELGWGGSHHASFNDKHQLSPFPVSCSSFFGPTFESEDLVSDDDTACSSASASTGCSIFLGANN